MAINPTLKATITFVDSSRENSAVGLNVQPATISGATPPTQNAEIAALLTALSDVTDGEVISVAVSVTERIANTEFSTAGNREDKLLVTIEDADTLRLSRIEIPCRKPTLATIAGSDFYDITASPFSELVAAIQAVARSSDGNAIRVKSVRLVGRNI